PKKPRITIGIIWNERHRHILDSVNSIKAQHYSPMAVLLLDNRDVSNGQESVVALSATLQRYRCLRPERVLSAGAARNLLAEHADGDYLLTIDADSILAPFALEKISMMA